MNVVYEQVNPMHDDPVESCYNGEKEQGGADIKIVIDGRILSKTQVQSL